MSTSMKMQSISTIALLATGLVTSAVASGHHAHHLIHDKRQASSYVLAPSVPSATCGCTTYTTTWYGEPGLVQDQPTAYASNTTIAVSSTTSEATSSTTLVLSSSSMTPSTSSPASWSTTSTSEDISGYIGPSSYSVPNSYAAGPTSASSASSYSAPSSAASSTTPSASSSSGTAGTISPNGNQWAMCYTPYADDGACKTADEVSSDIASIKAKGFTTVRLYATDCSGPQNVGSAAAANGLKLILGVYIDESGIGSNTDEQVGTLTSWGQGQWDLVEMVVFGNEAIFNGYTTASDLASALSSVKKSFQAAGYNGPITTTEPLGTIQENADTICGAVDVIAANIHPFFNQAVCASDAGSFVSSQLGDLAAACNNEKDAYNLETGWPSQGDANGLAVPGFSDQQTAISAIIAAAGSKSAMFSFDNDAWKAPGSLNVEQYWGCANLFRG